MLLYNPFEQFEITLISKINIGNIDISLDREVL